MIVTTRTTTDANGRYQLAVECGTYRVRFSGLPDGYLFSDPASGLTGPVTLTKKKPTDLSRNAAIYSPTGELPATGSEASLAWTLGGGLAAAALGGLLLITRRRRLG